MLTERERQAAIRARRGSTPVTVGDRFGVVWVDQTAPHAERWHGQLVHHVEEVLDADAGSITLRVWWEGAELVAATRQAVLRALAGEAGK